MTTNHDKAVLETIFNPNLPLTDAGDCDQSSGTGALSDENDEVSLKVKKLELEGVLKAEAGELKDAAQLLSRALSLDPTSASVLNNRAQVYRLLGDEYAAVGDLDEAVRLSEGQSKVRTQALCQRALVLRHLGDETSALKDLQAAAQLGSEFAKQQLVQINPYAAMCNHALKELFLKIQQNSG